MAADEFVPGEGGLRKVWAEGGALLVSPTVAAEGQAWKEVEQAQVQLQQAQVQEVQEQLQMQVKAEQGGAAGAGPSSALSVDILWE
jgi:hypothetical protein